MRRKRDFLLLEAAIATNLHANEEEEEAKIVSISKIIHFIFDVAANAIAFVRRCILYIYIFFFWSVISNYL